VPQPQPNAEPTRGLVAFEDKPREQASRAVLDGQGIRQPKIVLGDNIRVDEAHHYLRMRCNTAY